MLLVVGAVLVLNDVERGDVGHRDSLDCGQGVDHRLRLADQVHQAGCAQRVGGLAGGAPSGVSVSGHGGIYRVCRVP